MASEKTSARERFYATGRRKTSSARVFMRPDGRGEMIVNGKPLESYFTRATAVMIAKQAVSVAQSAAPKDEEAEAQAQEAAAPAAETPPEEKAAPSFEKFDFFVTVRGGGESGQAEAVRHGMARAFVRFDPSLQPKLRAAGLLRRDSREVERKKTGRLKARRARQYSKR